MAAQLPNPHNPKKGDVFYYLGRTKCTVEAETLRPGDGNREEALVQIRTQQGTPIVFLYKTSADYLSAVKIPIMKKWPLTVQETR